MNSYSIAALIKTVWKEASRSRSSLHAEGECNIKCTFTLNDLLHMRYNAFFFIYFKSEQRTSASHLLTSKQTRKLFMRGVTLTYHLYKRKGIRSCSLMRQVNRLLWINDVIGERVPILITRLVKKYLALSIEQKSGLSLNRCPLVDELAKDIISYMNMVYEVS